MHKFFFPNFFTDSYWSLGGSFRKFDFQVLGVKLGCAPFAWSWVFFKIFKIQVFVALLLSLKKAITMVFIWGDRWYPFGLNTKRPLSDIWLQNSFWCVRQNSGGLMQKSQKKMSRIELNPKIFDLHKIACQLAKNVFFF